MGQRIIMRLRSIIIIVSIAKKLFVLLRRGFLSESIFLGYISLFRGLVDIDLIHLIIGFFTVSF